MNYSLLYDEIRTTALAPWLERLPTQVEGAYASLRWGDLPKWQKAVDNLPLITPSEVDLNADAIRVGKPQDCPQAERAALTARLRELHPWRKGPFNLFGVEIETEWRSDMKWNRFKDLIAPLAGRLVLDIGCGSGYHCWRMAGAGARLVVGIDSTMLYVMQFNALQKYIRHPSVSVLPLGIDDLPVDFHQFDTVFSLGLLYHRRSPLDHLLQLKSFLRPGGEVVLETLVIEGKKGEVLNPQGTYAKMPNVWFIPSPDTLEVWLARMGFDNIRLIDVTKTTSAEQRATDWMSFQSLEDFLAPDDDRLTAEGYPAPRRAVFLANNP